ncbi:hypothetical protein F5Y14DRAFT_464367 [Nemania sp. NC0429]|nr:hypothetical protein F5Y14DRAFT_464367 [Nemania sp. NC0429]
MATRPAEHSLYRTVLRGNFEREVIFTNELQKYIPCHIDMLINGDLGMRDNFVHLQNWYTRALKISVEQVRERMDQIKLSELQGFTVPPITMSLEEEEEHLDNHFLFSLSSQFHGSRSLAEELPTEELSMDELNSPRSPPELEDFYDDEGFLTEEDDDNENGDMTEVEHDNQDTTEVDTGTISRGDGVGDDPETSQAESLEWDSDGSTEFNFDASPTKPGYSFYADTVPKNAPLSEELRSLLKEIGGNPEATRTGWEYPLIRGELSVLAVDWRLLLRELTRREARKGERYIEDFTETIFLDRLDEESGRCHWQKEGLFLCRLTELVYKDIFKDARRAFWAELMPPPGPRRRGYKQRRRRSPLRYEFRIK